MKALFASVALITQISGAGALAQTPPAIGNVVNCRGIADDQARLRCFDAAVGTLAVASSNGDLVVRDKAREREEEIKELAANIQSVSKFGYERWRIQLDKGGAWQTIEPQPWEPLPKVGKPVLVKRSFVGSYMMSIDGAPGIRVTRIR